MTSWTTKVNNKSLCSKIVLPKVKFSVRPDQLPRVGGWSGRRDKSLPLTRQVHVALRIQLPEEWV